MSARRAWVWAALLAAAAALASPPIAAAQSAWLPPPGRTVATLSYAFKSYRRAWVLGDTELDLGAGGGQHTVQLNLQRALSPRMAFDVAVGGTSAQFLGAYPSSGIADAEIGVEGTLLSHVPREAGVATTLAVRIAGVIPGSYPYARFGTAGSQASGLLAQLLGAADLSAWHVGFEGGAGYLERFSGRPDRWLGSVGMYARLAPALTLSTTYRYVGSLTGPDLFGKGFTLADFAVAREVEHNLEGAASVHVANDTDLTLFVARRLRGQNTEQATIAGVGLTRTFE